MMAILEDRVPGKPGRVLVTPENGGEAFYATLELADEPVVAGNKVNKQNVIDTIKACSIFTKEEITESGTWTAPDDIVGPVMAFVFGGGGYLSIGEVDVAAGTSVTVVIGAGGAGATSSAAAKTGGTSSFGSITAAGGSGGGNGSSSSVGKGGAGGSSGGGGGYADLGAKAGGAAAYGGGGGYGGDKENDTGASGGAGGIYGGGGGGHIMSDMARTARIGPICRRSSWRFCTHSAGRRL